RLCNAQALNAWALFSPIGAGLRWVDIFLDGLFSLGDNGERPEVTMSSRRSLAIVCVFGLVSQFPRQTHAQCAYDWSPGFGRNGFNGPVHVLTTLNRPSGNGLILVAGGAFFTASAVIGQPGHSRIVSSWRT